MSRQRKVHIILLILITNVMPNPTFAAEKLIPLDIGRVKVGGEIGRRIDITINNNALVLDTDRDFLRPFQQKNRQGGYIGLGKFIDCLVRFAAYSHDKKVLDLKKHVAAETIKTQETDGYIGIFKPERRMWHLWDIHEMGYIILGLTADYQYFKEKPSLEAAEKLANYIIGRWSDDPTRWTSHVSTATSAITHPETYTPLSGICTEM